MAHQDRRAGVGLRVRHLSVCGTPEFQIKDEQGRFIFRRRSKLILDDVSFSVSPGTFTAIIGPNGAGKTTLMKALSGEKPKAGRVLIDGEDMYADPEYWLRQIGYVPVDNILHEHLPLKDALLYIGRLRLPGKTEAEIESRVDELLDDFGFPVDDERRNQPIRLLSSGERKRANICSELIIDPPVLMLDEPTSNLDPDAERNLMHLLAKYAHNRGQTILVITHTLNSIDECDEILFIENSQLRAAGERDQVLEQLENNKQHSESGSSLFYRWAEVFDQYKTDESKRKDCSELHVPAEDELSLSVSHEIEPTSWSYQLQYLLSRYMRVRMGDRWSFIGTLLAGLSGILFFILPGKTFLEPTDPSEISLALNQARQSVYVVAIVVTLIGLITSYTEISKEFRIYRHERLKGLSPSAYFMSKWIWLTAAVGILAPIVLVGFIVLVYQQPFPDFPEPRIGETVGWWEGLIRFQIVGLVTRRVSWFILITLVLSCITSVTVGLLVSTLAGDSDKGYLYLSFTVVFIVLFSGLIRNEKLDQLVDTLSFVSTGRWAFEGFASSISIYCWLDSWRFEEFNSTGHIISIWLALMVFTLTAASLAIAALRLRDPWRDRWTNLRHLFLQNKLEFLLLIAIIVVLVSYTQFLRQQSHDYHMLNFWSRQEYGGTNAYEYANVQKVQDLDILQYWNGKINQSWCGDR